jgi:hypothetical protein
VIVARRLPRFRGAELEAEDARKLERLVEERPSGGGTDHHDPRRLRGLPPLGRNVTGAIRGTVPGTRLD